MPFLDVLNRQLLVRVALLGPWGAGKRTIMARIAAEPSSTVTRTVLFHVRAPSAYDPVEVVKLIVASRTAPYRVSATHTRDLPVKLSLSTQSYPDDWQGDRRLVGDVDGVIFVADSRAARVDAGARCVTAMRQQLGRHRRDEAVPWALLCTHRDAPDALPVAHVARALEAERWPAFEAHPPSGAGVLSAIDAIEAAALGLQGVEG